jgi:putative DNA primase/helicase
MTDVLAVVTQPTDWSVLGWVSMTDKRDAIALYVRLGLHPILLNGILDDGACTCGRHDCNKSRGKHPVPKNWQAALLDLGALDRALATNRHHNLGIRTGPQPNGRFLVVFDVDGSLALLDEYSPDEPFPPTLTARTGSGGYHLFYWLPTGIEWGNRTVLLGKRPKEQGNIDIRGAGGQVVAAPSIHLSGKRYHWINAREPAVLT